MVIILTITLPGRMSIKLHTVASTKARMTWGYLFCLVQAAGSRVPLFSFTSFNPLLEAYIPFFSSFLVV
jgi:hypothetical protein